MSFVVVAIVGASVVAAGATAKSVDGAVKAKKAKDRAADAKIELDKNKDMFASLDTSNPYMDLENTMEDLTVNQKEAEFSKQQSMQSQANIMQGMKGAAGGSGVAGLAQAMANQGSLDAQRSAASIGKQEQSNQMLRQQEAGKIQGLEREGELISRQAEMGKVSSMLGMSADELANAKQERADAQAQMYEGISEAGNAAMNLAGGQMGGGGGKKNSYDGTLPSGGKGKSTADLFSDPAMTQGSSGNTVRYDQYGNIIG
jgi:hypothetical protein